MMGKMKYFSIKIKYCFFEKNKYNPQGIENVYKKGVLLVCIKKEIVVLENKGLNVIIENNVRMPMITEKKPV
jgi:hypothetical protein